MERIKILIVEDDQDWLKLMTQMINHEDDLIVVGTALNKDEAVQSAKMLDVDVVLMDINLTDNNYDGIYAAVEICEIKKVKIIMLTSFTHNDAIRQSFAAGAVHFIAKKDCNTIPAVVRSLFNDFSPMEVLLEDYHRLKREEELHSLTPSEREIFDLVEQGLTQSQIEKKLFKTERTLKNQVSAIIKKLGVRSSKEAVEKVRRKGIFRK